MFHHYQNASIQGRQTKCREDQIQVYHVECIVDKNIVEQSSTVPRLAWAWQLWVTIYFCASSVILHASLCDKTNNDDSETSPRILSVAKEN